MIYFCAGFACATGIAIYKARRKEAEYRGTLIAIFEGKAEPDEYGHVGWGIGV